MKNYKSIESIESDISLTPWEKECEKIILNHAFTPTESAAMLRLLYKFKNDTESTFHYQGTSYRGYIISNTTNLIEALLS